MAAAAAESASAAEVSSDGPVLSLMNKRLRALRKKYNRILQMEENKAQGKALNKEQEEVLSSKSAVAVLIDEYEKLRQPLSVAVQEELSTVSATASSSSPSSPRKEPEKERELTPPATAEAAEAEARVSCDPDADVEDLLNLLYFGCLFDVKQQSEFTSTMLTRTHERGCCLTYDYVTDDATDLLGERDLDLISALGSLVLSRPAHASFSHKSALLGCLQHAKHWLRNSDVPIEPGSAVTYAALRQRLSKILASDYFTTAPEFKAPVDVAAAVGKYATCQMQVANSSTAQPHNVGTEDPLAHNQLKDDDQENILGKGTTSPNQSTSTDEPQMDEIHDMNLSGSTAAQEEQQKSLTDEEQSQRDFDSKDQQYVHRRTYQNQRGGDRGGGGGRRGYANGRGGRGGRGGGGGYQNGRSQYYDHGYYPRNYYNTRGRGGRGGGGGSGTYNNNYHGAAADAPEP